MILTLSLVLAQCSRSAAQLFDEEAMKVANGIESLSSKIVLTEAVRNKTFAKTELSKEMLGELETKITSWPSAKSLDLKELAIQLAMRNGISSGNAASHLVLALYMTRDLDITKWNQIRETHVMKTYYGIGLYKGDWNSRTGIAPWRTENGVKCLTFDRAIMTASTGFSLGGWLLTFKPEEFSDFWEK